MNFKTCLDHMLDQLHDSMYEEKRTAPEIRERGGIATQPAEYESFCTRCHVMADTHPNETDCPVGQIEHKLRELYSRER
jgi:hypothetical protein